ncbi:MAG: hypothetical protein IJV04_04680, partial [Lachnospiraceae bacterium]|nr:hypothetical protein [Lachnospiraceae bacterium]
FLDENLFSDVVVNNILGPVAFYEVELDGQVRLIRMNEQYCRLLGRKTVPMKNESEMIVSEQVMSEHHGSFPHMFDAAFNAPLTGIEDEIHLTKPDGEEIRVKIRLFFLRERFGVRVFYASLSPIGE